MSVEVARCRVEEIIPLRHRILRQGLPIEEATFAGDEDETTVHFVARRDGEVVGCATLRAEPYQGEPAYRLRGMAVDTHRQGGGVGRLLLNAVDAFTLEKGFTLLWCNARLIAIPFYEKLGWKIVSGLFDIPTAGPHHVMIKRLTTSGEG